MVDSHLFPTNKRIQRGNHLRDFTLRDFSGGWNVSDSDLNLSLKYSTELYNMHRSTDGAIEIRPGTKLFADTSDYIDEIINMEFYNGHVVAFGKNGIGVKIDTNGNVYVIWNTEIASKLPGTPSAWDESTIVTFAEFNGELIVCNGVNKPLLIPTNFNTTYLQDLANTTNVNTPICKYVIAHARYLVMAGDPDNTDRIYISRTDVSGTWAGDSSPNDAVNIDLGSRVPTGSAKIKGIGQFRDKIAVFFDEAVLPGTLGVFTSSDHTPTFDDAIEEHGSISHRVIKTIGENMLFCDLNGLSSITRAAFTGDIKPERVSHFVDPEIQRDLDRLATATGVEERAWAVYDSQANNYMLFIPNDDNESSITEYRCFVLKSSKAQKIHAWQEFRNWKFRCGCRSNLKKMYFGTGTQVFLLGDTPKTRSQSTVNPESLTLDYIGDQEMFDDDTSFDDYTGWNPVASTADSGVPIKFIWELPWTDFGQRFLVKNTRHINFDTVGTQTFTAQMFTDNIYFDKSDVGEDFVEDTLKFDDGTGWDVDVLDPTLSMEFVGGDSAGFGTSEFGASFGGGRATSLEQLYAWVAKFKLSKLRIYGDGIDQLKFVSNTISFLTGSARR